MRLGVIAVASSLQAEEKEETFQIVESTLKDLEELGVDTDFAPPYATDPEEAGELLDLLPLDEVDAISVIVVTGGTEGIIVETLREISLPVFLLANSRNNSFAAACEALPRLRSMKKHVKLVFSENMGEDQIREMERTVGVEGAVQELRRTRLGLIGFPSPWLVSTTDDFQLIEDKIGPHVILIDLSKLMEEIENVSDSEARSLAKELLSNVSNLVEPSEYDVTRAAKIYLGLYNLIKRNDLDAVSVGCFELIPQFDNTGCLALSRLIDEGIIAGCEGDLDTTITMLILHLLTSGPVWLANTCSVDFDANTMTFAHCTVSIKMLEQDPKLRSHFESGKGVAIQGGFKVGGEVTIARLGGPNLDRMMITSGVVSRSDMGREDMCRTQVEVELYGRAEDFMDNSLGNHVAIVMDEVTAELEEICSKLGVKALRI